MGVTIPERSCRPAGPRSCRPGASATARTAAASGRTCGGEPPRSSSGPTRALSPPTPRQSPSFATDSTTQTRSTRAEPGPSVTAPLPSLSSRRRSSPAPRPRGAGLDLRLDDREGKGAVTDGPGSARVDLVCVVESVANDGDCLGVGGLSALVGPLDDRGGSPPQVRPLAAAVRAVALAPGRHERGPAGRQERSGIVTPIVTPRDRAWAQRPPATPARSASTWA